MLTKEWGLLASKSFLAGLDIVVDSNPIVQQLRERRKANVRCFQITGKKPGFPGFFSWFKNKMNHATRRGRRIQKHRKICHSVDVLQKYSSLTLLFREVTKRIISRSPLLMAPVISCPRTLLPR